MSLKLLSEKVQESYYNKFNETIPDWKLKYIINSVFEEIKNITVKQPCKIKYFGTFLVKEKPSQSFNSPIAPNIKELGEYHYPRFTPATHFRSLVRYSRTTPDVNLSE